MLSKFYFYAVKKNYLKLVKLLIAIGVDVNTSGGPRCYMYFPVSALFLACYEGYLELAKFLLEKGADVNTADANGHTPLHMIANLDVQQKGRVSIELATLLIKAGANINKVSFEGVGFTALYTAYANDFIEMSDLLLKNGAEINKTTPQVILPPTSLLEIACRREDFKVAKSLVQAMLLRNAEEKKPNYLEKYDGISTYWHECQSERLALRRVIFTTATFGRVTMQDFLMAGTSKMSLLSSNEEIRKMIMREDFIEKFPIFGNKIKEKLKKGSNRNEIIDRIIENLNSLREWIEPQSWGKKIMIWISSFFIEEKTSLKNKGLIGPEEIDRKILSYLNNKNLELLEEASSDSFSKNRTSKQITFFSKYTMQNSANLESVPTASFSYQS